MFKQTNNNMSKETVLKVGDFEQSYYTSPKKIKSRKRRSVNTDSFSLKDVKGTSGNGGDLNTSMPLNSSSNVHFNSGNESEDYIEKQVMQGNAFLENSNIGYVGDSLTSDPIWITDWKQNDWWKYQPTPYPIYNETYLSNNITITNTGGEITTEPKIKLMKPILQFFSLPGYKKEDLKVAVVKDQIQVTAERDEIEGFDQDDRNCTFENAIKFDPETYDGKKVNVSYLNGLLRIEVPLREDIVEEIAIG